MNGLFYNHMPFPVNLRKTWIEGAPPVVVKPGETIEGPIDYLKQFSFLKAIPFNFHQVPSITQSDDFEYSDEMMQNPTEPRMYVQPPNMKPLEQEPYQKMPVLPQVPHEYLPKDEPVEKASEEMIAQLPFDITDSKWVMKTDNEVLKQACQILNISTDELEKKGGRDFRWGMIKKIKEAIAKE